MRVAESGLVCARCTRGAQGSALWACVGRSESLFIPSSSSSTFDFWTRGVRWLWAVLPERGMVKSLIDGVDDVLLSP